MFKSFKKNPRFILHIYFVSFLFLIQFSTNHIKAETFNIDNVEVKEPYDINFNKPKVVDKAFNKAFKELFLKITSSSDHEIINNFNILSIKSLVDSFTIVEEKFVNQNYVAIFDVDFDKKKIMNFLEEKNIFPSIPKKKKFLFIPIIIDEEKKDLLIFNNNEIFKNWNKNLEKTHLIEYILPTEDLEDLKQIKKNYENIENYDFKEVISKYNLKDSIISLVFKNGDQLRVLSRITYNNSVVLKNQTFTHPDINTIKKDSKLINELKIIYEDHWKKINKINTSIKLPLNIKISNENNEILSNFEKNLNNLDFVNYFFITKLDKNFTYYQIIFNGTPSLFLKIMEENNFSFNTQNKIWSIK